MFTSRHLLFALLSLCLLFGLSIYSSTYLSLTLQNSFKHENYHCHCILSGYHSNDLPSVNTLYGVSTMSHCVETIRWLLIIFWCGHVKCCMLYEGDGLRLTIYVCYSWQMSLTPASTYHSIRRRTGKEYGRKQKKLIPVVLWHV
jgi:hypothetical protein